MLTSTLVCVLAALVAPRAADELLPATPEGWRYERLDLPLDFAPELPYKGFEELRFAPGMFTAGAKDFWSYAFVIQTTTPEKLGARELTTILRSYYGGLCEAVAAGKGFDFERKSLRIAMEDHGDRFVASIDMIDAFVTGEPLSLRLELSVFESPTSTELLGIASPAATDAEVWATLHAISDRWRDAQQPEVFFNHLFFAPDAETYAALLAAPILRKGFAAHEERTTKRPDMTYSGLYFYGQNTYFEFLKPSGATPNEVGSTGLALGLERDGATAGVKARLTEAGIPCFDGPTSRQLGEASIPWFHAMGLQQAHVDSSMQLFALEYDERFLGEWHKDLAPKHDGIARRQVLTRYAAAIQQSAVHGVGLLQDITEVHLDLDEREGKSFGTACRAFGYVRAATENGIEWQGPRVRYVVSTCEAPGGLTGFKSELRRTVATQSLTLGKATLHLEGQTATFTLPR